MKMLLKITYIHLKQTLKQVSSECSDYFKKESLLMLITFRVVCNR